MKFGEQLQEHIHSTSAYSSQVYIDYNTLKRSIHARCTQHRAHCLAETARFKRALRKGMATVNAFFVRMEAGLLERCAESPHSAQSAASVAELQQYAVLNYVAVLKILKKHDKHCATRLYPVVEGILRAQPFARALLSSPLFYAPSAPGLPAPGHSAAAGGGGTAAAPPTGQAPSAAAAGAPAEQQARAEEAPCAICLESCCNPRTLGCCSAPFCMLCLANAAAAGLRGCPLCRAPWRSLHPVDVGLRQLNISLRYSPRGAASAVDAPPRPPEADGCARAVRAPCAEPAAEGCGADGGCVRGVAQPADDGARPAGGSALPPAQQPAQQQAQTPRQQQQPTAVLSASGQSALGALRLRRGAGERRAGALNRTRALCGVLVALAALCFCPAEHSDSGGVGAGAAVSGGAPYVRAGAAAAWAERAGAGPQSGWLSADEAAGFFSAAAAAGSSGVLAPDESD